jgi:pimeloyl-ACP methyl ester carboxylesterase
MMPLFHTTASGYRIAYAQQPGKGVGVVFLPGYRSEMASTKATALAEFCVANRIPLTRFDYFAHGASAGQFIDFTMSRARDDVLEILDHIAVGPQILVGSSMGGWLGLLAATERREQVCGFVGVAAAPDFTTHILHGRMNDRQREEILREGVVYVHSDHYNNDYPMTLKFIEDGNSLALLDHPIPLEIPMHLIHGQRDDEVKWETSLAIADRVISRDVTVTLIKDGDHRLNREHDLAVLMGAVKAMRVI